MNDDSITTSATSGVNNQTNLFWKVKNGPEMRLRPNRIQRAIVLYGAKGVGKTQTLNLLIDLLISKSGMSENECIIAKDVSKYDSSNGQGDRCVLVRVFEKLVCIMTGGDYGEPVSLGIKMGFRYNADILVSATRKRSDSDSWCAFWDDLVAHGIPYTEIEKTMPNANDEGLALANDMAKKLADIIRFA